MFAERTTGLDGFSFGNEFTVVIEKLLEQTNADSNPTANNPMFINSIRALHVRNDIILAVVRVL